jgi:peptidoglycan/LPS O-acetylase OafA/YrhL
MNASGMRMPGLDLLRLVAALALMVCHAGFWLGPFRIPDTFWMFLGHAGVEAFLVILSFLLTQHALTADTVVTLRRSWARSALRLWPLYVLMLGANLVLLPAGGSMPPLLEYLTLTQNLAWPHPEFFGEAWIVAAAAMILFVVPVLCRLLQGQGFAAGLGILLGLLLVTNALRGLLVWAGDPSFDLGVRKILIARLDLPLYGALAAWLSVHRYAGLMQWRRVLQLAGLIALALTAWVHLRVPLDESASARILLFPLCDLAWVGLLLWVCSKRLPDRFTEVTRVLAASCYAGLLTHITVLRIGAALDLPLYASTATQGVMMLLSYVLLASGTAVLVYFALDRPLLALRGRWLDPPANHPVPVAKR